MTWTRAGSCQRQCSGVLRQGERVREDNSGVSVFPAAYHFNLSFASHLYSGTRSRRRDYIQVSYNMHTCCTDKNTQITLKVKWMQIHDNSFSHKHNKTSLLISKFRLIIYKYTKFIIAAWVTILCLLKSSKKQNCWLHQAAVLCSAKVII